MIGHGTTTFTATVNATGYDLSVHDPYAGPEMIKRVIGCTFVSFMPDRGLDEVISTLLDYFEYYSPQRAELPEKAEQEVRDFTGHLVTEA